MRDFNGSKEAFAAALYDLAEKNEKMVGVFPDSIKAMRATDFGKAYPDRAIECGIAEQGAVDVCAGLAASGMVPLHCQELLVSLDLTYSITVLSV